MTTPPGRTAVVTASDSGIGKATAVALAEAGMDIGITWHSDEAGAQATADEVRATGRRAEVRRLDLEQLPGADVERALAAFDATHAGADDGPHSHGVPLGSPGP